MALIGGLQAPPGRIMGHAGAWTAPGEPDATAKYQALERAGVTMIYHPERFGEGMKTLLSNRQMTTVSFCKFLMPQKGADGRTAQVQRIQQPDTRPSHHETDHTQHQASSATAPTYPFSLHKTLQGP